MAATAAEQAARQLAASFGLPRLPLEVEAVLHARPGAAAPGRFVDPVALAGLIVSTASLAWQIYSDKKKEGEEQTPDTLRRMVLIRRREITDLTGTEEKIIEVVAAEIIKAADDEE